MLVWPRHAVGRGVGPRLSLDSHWLPVWWPRPPRTFPDVLTSRHKRADFGDQISSANGNSQRLPSSRTTKTGFLDVISPKKEIV